MQKLTLHQCFYNFLFSFIIILTLDLSWSYAAPGEVTSIAGTGNRGFSGDGSLATNAMIDHPAGIYVDINGIVYFSDYLNNRIRKIDQSGIITTFAGTGERGYSGDGGLATDALFDSPRDIYGDEIGNIYIADKSNYVIRKVNPSGIISTVMGYGGRLGSGEGDGGPALEASVRTANCVFVDEPGNIYIGDLGRIRKVDSSTGIITTIAGYGSFSSYSGDGGPAIDARITDPHGIVTDNTGNVYFSDTDNHRIRMIDKAGMISTVAGGGNVTSGFGDGGPASEAQLNRPYGILLDHLGQLLIADFGNGRIRRVNTSGVISTIVKGWHEPNDATKYEGDGSPAIDAGINPPAYIHMDLSGNLYVSDWWNHRIRFIEAPIWQVNLSSDHDTLIIGRLEKSVIQASIHDLKGQLQQGDNSTQVEFSMTYGEGEISETNTTVINGMATTSVETSVPGIISIDARIEGAWNSSIRVLVVYAADLNSNGEVEFSDFLTFAESFGKSVGDDGFIQRHDFDNDDKIDFSDFLLFAQEFLKNASL